MSKNALTVLALLALTFSVTIIGQQQPGTIAGAHLGTWQLVSTKYGDVKEFSGYPPDRRRLKMITSTHFVWVDYGTENKQVSASAGGSYSLVGNKYTETIEFAGAGMDSYLGKKQVFTIAIEDDRLKQSGELSDGLKIEEIWKRVK